MASSRPTTSRILLALAIVTGGGMLAYLHGRHGWAASIAPDSSSYHYLAVNMLAGRGYYDGPVGDLADYDQATQRLFRRPVKEKPVRPTIVRTPGYALFLAAIYSLHGVAPDVVVRYQLLLVALVGMLMVWTGWRMWGWTGCFCGLMAVFCYGMNRDASYPCTQILTECLATFLLTASFASAAWARRGGILRDGLAGFLMILAILTRPGLLFVGLVYGAHLLWPLGKASLKRAAAFACPCILGLAIWASFASYQAGRLVVLTQSGKAAILAGLDPRGVARLQGRDAPEIEQKSLEDFWRSFSADPDLKGSIPLQIRRIPSRWREVAAIERAKLKAATDLLPRSLWACMLAGVALASSLGLVYTRPQGPQRVAAVIVAFRGIPGSAVVAKVAWLLIATVLGVILLGFSSTSLQGLLLVCGLCFGWRIRRCGSVPEPEMQNVCRGPGWVNAWLWGLVLMILISFGIHRFTRPFLPVLYLCAAMAVPLLVCLLLALVNAEIDVRGRIRFVFAQRISDIAMRFQNTPPVGPASRSQE